MIKELKSFLFPDYDELSVFLMSLVLMLLLYFDVGCRDEILSHFKLRTYYADRELSAHIVFVAFTALIIIAGILSSIFHILIQGEKGALSESSMKAFALFVSGYIGIKSGMHVMEKENYLFLISPGWNILIGIISIYSLGYIDEVPFDQTDAKFLQTVLNIVLVGIIFYFLYFVLHLYWALVFSICINYVVCVNRGTLNSKVLKLHNLQR